MQVLYVIRSTVFKTLARDSTQLSSYQKASIAKGQSFPLLSARLEGKHYRVQLQQDLPPVGKTGYFFAEHVQIKTVSDKPPLKNRAVWLANTDSEVLASSDQIKAAMQRLSDLNFNTIYPVVWQRGHTLYPSQVAQQVTGSVVLPMPQFQQRDMLAELLQIAKDKGFRVIPWFEYGLMAPPSSALAQRHPEWLTQQANGDKLKNGMVWLNPSHPDATTFLIDLIREIVDQYDIDGIQFDDHFGMPVELGYDDVTKTLYRQQTGQEPPANSAAPSWITWRANQITNLMAQISQCIKRKPNCLVSMSPNPYSFSLNRYLADWRQWEKTELIDELVVQLYRDQLQAFEAELAKPELIAARNHIPVSIGILTGLKSRSINLRQIQQQVVTVRQRGFAGVSFFFYETVIHQTLSPPTTGDRLAANLKALFA